MRFAHMGAPRHESYDNDITPPSRSVAKVLPPRVSGSTSRVGIHLGDTPRGLRHPRGVPSVDPSTLGGSLHTQGVKAFTTSLRSGNVTLPYDPRKTTLVIR